MRSVARLPPPPVIPAGRPGPSILRLHTPTDSCRDRLAGYLYWNDRGNLEQAIAVARRRRDAIDLRRIGKWCRAEGFAGKYREFEAALV